MQYNQKGQPVGKVMAKYACSLGLLARTMIPIVYKSWFKVPNELKDKVWSCVEVCMKCFYIVIFIFLRVS